ncbi:hypothetical protein [Desulforamulus aquiferis]|uniref:Uncharacterized protein n=1 Tax=Desulforamulus aquiferis TaxID=1397668 RepID=A0AAW7ZGT3_9FIRM|nr:hypothetical protein [Desulforamulus aquiferis]MDO7788546.1 hypothetical protein [Desulforamulus aquiferis]RYD02278.1 hypothetical protein N752_26045 [Desulforamulus aquiferis]
MNLKEIDQRYIYWWHKNRWCIAKVQVSPSSDLIYLYIWRLDGSYVGMTAGKRPEIIRQSQGYKLWLQEGQPDLKERLDLSIKNKYEQIEFF